MMKKTIILLISIVVLAINSCSNSDDNDPAPKDFSLKEVANGAIGVDVNPTFSWHPAIDPNSAEVTYDLFLDNNSNPITIVAHDISDTTFTIEMRLPLEEIFFWKVIAKYNTGETRQSSTFSFTTRNLNIPNSAESTSEHFSPRLGHTLSVLDDKLWVIGGADDIVGRKNDVWSSNDGQNWTEVTSEAPFSARLSHTTAVFDNKLWVIGGSDKPVKGGRKNDVWSSSDGHNWTEVTTAAPFSARMLHATVVFDNKLWVIGGDEFSNYKNDIWNSSDGNSWTEVTAAASFSARHSHAAVVFDNKIWIIGGENEYGLKADVWSSSDGIVWTQINAFAPFYPRTNFTLEVFDNKLWVIAGWDSLGKPRNDIWSSSDGIIWNEVASESSFSARSGHATTVFVNKIWLIGGGGDDSLLKNDVWAMD